VVSCESKLEKVLIQNSIAIFVFVRTKSTLVILPSPRMLVSGTLVSITDW